MDKTAGSIGDAIAWAETGRRQDEEKIKQQMAFEAQVQTDRFNNLKKRIEELETQVEDLQIVVLDLCDKLLPDNEV
jgi:polyhydroxyalkanoate synthesis regulator phasin